MRHIHTRPQYLSRQLTRVAHRRKKQAIDTLGEQKARENRQAIYLGASAIAEFFADIGEQICLVCCGLYRELMPPRPAALCPLEATRIRLVSQPTFANGLLGGFARIAREEGIAGFYAGSVTLARAPRSKRR